MDDFFTEPTAQSTSFSASKPGDAGAHKATQNTVGSIAIAKADFDALLAQVSNEE